MHWTSLSSADWDCPFHSEGKKVKEKGAHGCWNHEGLPASYQHDWALNSLCSLSTLLALHSSPSTSKAFSGKLQPLCSSNSISASASQQNNSIVPLPSSSSIKKDAPLLVWTTSADICQVHQNGVKADNFWERQVLHTGNLCQQQGLLSVFLFAMKWHITFLIQQIKQQTPFRAFKIYPIFPLQWS